MEMQTKEWADEQTGRQSNGQMNEQADERMGGQTNGHMN